MSIIMSSDMTSVEYTRKTCYNRSRLSQVVTPPTRQTYSMHYYHYHHLASKLWFWKETIAHWTLKLSPKLLLLILAVIKTISNRAIWYDTTDDWWATAPYHFGMRHCQSRLRSSFRQIDQCDLLNTISPIGCCTILFPNYFRQIFSIVKIGTRADNINASPLAISDWHRI